MSTSLRAHSTILKQVRKGNPREDLRRQRVFAWSVTALLMLGKTNLTRWAMVLNGETQAMSRWRRLWRFFNNPRVDVDRYYRPFIEAVLESFRGEEVEVAIDCTSPKGACVVCRVALMYRGRSLPLVWRTFDTRGHTLAFQDYRPLLDQASQLLGEVESVTLLGDRGFGNVDLMKWCQAAEWHFVLRIKRSRQVHFPWGQSHKAGDFHVKASAIRHLENVKLSGFGKARVGPVQIFMVRAPGDASETWILATDRRDGCSVVSAYSRRFHIEHSFRDDKSGGFDWESSRLTAPAQVDRLLLVMAVATLYAVSEGVFVVESGLRKTIDPHTKRGLSYIQIGMRAIQRKLIAAKSIGLKLSINPKPDPAPLRENGIPFLLFEKFEFIPGNTLPTGT